MLYPPHRVCSAAVLLKDEEPHPLVDAAIERALAGVLKYLPDAYWSDTIENHTDGPTIPLHDALTNCGKAIYEVMVNILYDEDLKKQNLLSEWRKQLWENEAQANGLSMYERRRTSVPEPHERDEPPDKLCWLYFHKGQTLRGSLHHLRLQERLQSDTREKALLLLRLQEVR